MASPAARSPLREAVVAAVAVAVIHVLFRLSGSFLFGVFDDDGVYVVLGKAIAQGAGYRSIHLVGAPLQLRYPPGLPLLLAVPWALGGSLGAVRAAVAVLSALVMAGSAGLIWWIGRRQMGIARWPLAVLALGPLTLDAAIQFYNLPLSEPYFVLGWAAALALVTPLMGDEASRATGPPRSRSRAAGVGLVLAATTLFRAAGIALVPAMLAALWFRRRRAEAVVCAATALVPLAAWAALRWMWTARSPVSPFPDDLGYWRWLGARGLGVAVVGVAHAMAANVPGYVAELASLLAPLQWLGIAVVVMALLLAAAGAARARRQYAPLGLTVLSVTALTLAWPYTQGRLMLPILPYAGLLVAAAVHWGVQGRSRRLARGVTMTLAVVAAVVVARQVQLRVLADRSLATGSLPRPRDRSPTIVMTFRSVMIAQMDEWVRQHTTLQDRLMVQAPSGIYLYTGRRAVSAIPAESPLTPSVFDTRGTYLARRILADSLTVLVRTPVTDGLGRDIDAVRAACPGVLERDPASPPSGAPVYYRVRREEACLRGLALAGSRPAGS